MKKNEFEKKICISKDVYNRFCSCFKGRSINRMQVNYYYDTADCFFRNRHITCRIRQKDQDLIGMLKRHGVMGNSEDSMEEPFFVKGLPYSFEVENQRVFLQGVLITERREILICDGIYLMLDKNTYLGETDYEIEIEFDKEKEQIAEGIMTLLEKWTDSKRSNAITESKMDRFFFALDQMCGNRKSETKYVSYDPDAYIKTDILMREK